MDFKYYFIFFLFVISLLSITSVHAIDVDDNGTEDMAVDDSFNQSLSSFDDDLLGKTYTVNGGKFSDVQSIINKAKAGDAICLSGKFTASKSNSIININKRLTITSTGTATFDGKGISGIFNIKTNAKGSVISNLKFVNGYRFAASAIYIDAKDITIRNCVFEDNVGSGNGGGAVATSWDQNTASGLTITDSVFRRNVAPASSGAVAAFSTNFKIINCIFEDNAAFNNVGRTAYEGALQVGMDNTYGLVSGCTFRNNYVISDDESKPSYGGATGIRKGTVMENCYFEGNSADKGGAIYFFSEGTIKNCQFINNIAIYGGAVYTGASSSTIQDCTFKDNSAVNGGAVFSTDCQLTISGSDFDKCLGENGGVIYSFNSEFNIFDSNFIGNFADYGGVIYANEKVGVLNSNFLNNSAMYGGVIFSNCNELLLTDCLFENNSALYGGALIITNISKVEVNDCNFNNNSALNGSAIFNNGILDILNSSFKVNKANSYNITSSDNSPVKKGEDLIIVVKLLVGDNVVDAIYNQGNVTIDDVKPKQSSFAINHEIVLVLNDDTYIETTDDEGIAEFIIDTSDLDVGNCTYFFIFLDSELYTGINDNSTVEILENQNNDSNSKKRNDDVLGSYNNNDNVVFKYKTKKKSKKQSTQNYLKSKGYTNLKDLVINNSQKYSYTIDENRLKLNEKYRNDKGISDYLYNMWKINWPHTYSFEQYFKDSNYMNVLLLLIGPFGLPATIVSYYTSGKMYEANADGDIWKILNSEFIHFYGYNSHFADEKGAKALLSLLFGIDENGNMSIGNTFINLLSLLCGLGITGSGILSRLAENNIFRIFKNSEIYFEFSRYGRIVKDAFFDVFNMLSKPVNVVNTIIGRIGKKFVDSIYVLYDNLYSFYFNDVRNVFNFLNPENQQNVKNNLNTLTNSVINKLSNSLKSIKNTVTNIVSNFNKKVKKVINKVNNTIKKVQNKINNVVKNVKSSVKQVTAKVGKLVNQVKTKIKQLTKKVGKLANQLKTKIKQLTNKVQNTVKNIKATVNTIKNKTSKIIKNEVNKVVSKIKTTIKTVKNTVKKVQTKVNNAVKTVKNTVKQVKTKGANLVKTAKTSIQKFKTRVINTYNVIKNNARGVYNAGTDTIKKGVNWGVTKAKQAYNWGVTKVKQAYNWGVAKAKQGISWVRNTFHI